MNRRKFLRLSAPLALAPLALDGISLRAFAPNSLMQQLSCEGVSDRVLVLVQLKGGNDGINTFIPIAQYDTYANLRPTIRIPATGTGAYIPLDNTLAAANQIGLHPAMTALKNLYDAGKVNIVQGVGYANQNRSHFKGTDIWLTGGDSTAENYNLTSGWMGRYLGYSYPGIGGNPTVDMPDPLGIQLGSSESSLGFHTADEHTASINLSGQDPSGFYSLVSEIGGAPIANVPNSEYGNELQFIMDVEQSISVYAERITSVFNAGTNSATVYPDWRLADQLRTVARLISGGSRTKIYLTQLGGFDTHNVQIDPSEPSIGIHATLLQELSESIKAFQDDLQALGLDDRVMTLTFSEFGRKAAENGNWGTDHGTLAPMMLFGKGVQAGVTGTNVNLGDLANDSQLQYQQYDYRQVFTTVLQDWLGAANDTINATLFEDYLSQKLPLVANNYLVSPDCYLSAIANSINPDTANAATSAIALYPNPVRGLAQLRYQSPRYTDGTISIWHNNGAQVSVRKISLQQGDNQLVVPVQNLPAGSYWLRLNTTDGISETLQMVVY